MSIYSGDDVLTADLVVDAIYQGSKTEKGGVADPLVKLVKVSRQGGFRYRGTRERPTLLVLTSNLAEADWPDELDPTTGRFLYYGDNRHPGHQLHDTPRFGNTLLKGVFDRAHNGKRNEVPPILVFTKEGMGRSFRFRGLAVPGYPGMPATEDLVAVWKTAGMERFQNYRSVFTILDVPVIDRDWLTAVNEGISDSPHCPAAWKSWVDGGLATPLMAPRSQLIRSRAEQLPKKAEDKLLIDVIKNRYKNNSYGFEVCAAAIVKLLLPSVIKLDLTRPWRDGGRDGIGTLRLGQEAASIEVVFALEAKCYSNASVGVPEASRLISRIKHREFGVLVTTSYIHEQAYKEIATDGHPVILVCAADIVRLLRVAGFSTPNLVEKWLDSLTIWLSA